jgi:endonuclease YncB( thermonuclease family)
MRYTRTVKKIVDGDTFVVNRKIGNTNRIRLANVNAPAKNQFGGGYATNALRGFVGGRKISITPVGRSYDRIVAEVTQNRRNMNKRMNEKLRR